MTQTPSKITWCVTSGWDWWHVTSDTLHRRHRGWNSLSLTHSLTMYLTPMLLVVNSASTKRCKNIKKNDWNPGIWVLMWQYTQRELSNEKQHDRDSMLFKILCILVLWTKIASTLEGLLTLSCSQIGQRAWHISWIPRIPTRFVKLCFTVNSHRLVKYILKSVHSGFGEIHVAFCQRVITHVHCT